MLAYPLVCLGEDTENNFSLLKTFQNLRSLQVKSLEAFKLLDA